jgi:hypothetical protein
MCLLAAHTEGANCSDIVVNPINVIIHGKFTFRIISSFHVVHRMEIYAFLSSRSGAD